MRQVVFVAPCAPGCIREPREGESIRSVYDLARLLTDIAKCAFGEHLLAGFGNGAHDELRVGVASVLGQWAACRSRGTTIGTLDP